MRRSASQLRNAELEISGLRMPVWVSMQHKPIESVSRDGGITGADCFVWPCQRERSLDALLKASRASVRNSARMKSGVLEAFSAETELMASSIFLRRSCMGHLS